MGTLRTIDSANIMLDSRHPAASQGISLWEHGKPSLHAREGRDAHRVIVSDSGSGFPRYIFHHGYSAYTAARETRAQVLAEILEAVDTQGSEELHLADLYRSGLFSPMTIGRAWLAYTENAGISMNELSRRIDVTPGTIHHYTSLVTGLAPALQQDVESNRLKFKSARAIAALEGHEHQLRWAAPFLDGRLSSGQVERLVQIAKKDPSADVDIVAGGILTSDPVERSSSDGDVTIDGPATARVGRSLFMPRDPQDLKGRIFAICAELDGLSCTEIPEVQRMGLAAALRALEKRLSVAMDVVAGTALPILQSLHLRKAEGA